MTCNVCVSACFGEECLCLTAFHEIKLCACKRSFAVVKMLHVAGVLIRSHVQTDGVSLVRLQGFWIFEISNEL